MTIDLDLTDPGLFADVLPLTLGWMALTAPDERLRQAPAEELATFSSATASTYKRNDRSSPPSVIQHGSLLPSRLEGRKGPSVAARTPSHELSLNKCRRSSG